MADSKKKERALYTLGIFLAVAASTGAVVGGAHIIAATTLTPVVET